MTERDHGEDRDYPDGSVGRYVRERWGSVPTHPARAARPYVPPVEPRRAPARCPSPKRTTEAESADVWAYQPDAPWSQGPDAAAGTVRPEATETDHTQVDPGRAGASHDPFAGVEYGSATWATAGPARRSVPRKPTPPTGPMPTAVARWLLQGSQGLGRPATDTPSQIFRRQTGRDGTIEPVNRPARGAAARAARGGGRPGAPGDGVGPGDAGAAPGWRRLLGPRSARRRGALAAARRASTPPARRAAVRGGHGRRR